MINPDSDNASAGKRVLCDCCGEETLARFREDGHLVITDRRGGRKHTAVVIVAPPKSKSLLWED